MRLIMPNGLVLVVVDVDGLVFLGVDEDLFFTAFVFESQFVEAIGLVSCALAASILFFVVTNFAVWATWYKASPEMFLPCYLQAIPFFRYTLLGDLSFGTMLFGGYAFCTHVLRDRVARPNVVAA